MKHLWLHHCRISTLRSYQGLTRVFIECLKEWLVYFLIRLQEDDCDGDENLFGFRGTAWP